MFQSFDSAASPEQGPERLAQLRAALATEGLSGFLVPRADAHQGEYVAARDERLQWLTGFTGSAGFAIVLPHIAGVFIDGRYRVQVKAQVDLTHFTPVPWPETSAGDWIAAQMTQGLLGFDPWLHTADEIAKIEATLAATQVQLVPVLNMIDAIWPDQADAPEGKVFLHPDHLAGKTSAQKRAEIAAELQARGEQAVVITLPDSICWLLNIRGADVPKNPVMQGFAILYADGAVDLFAARAKFSDAVLAALGPDVRLHAPDAFETALTHLQGPVRVDQGQAPLAVTLELEGAGIARVWGDDPCRLRKACKTSAEIEASREAHLRDGAAVTEFLAWLDAQPENSLTEITVVKALEDFRRATNVLHDISFDTICGAGPNGAIIHYRVTHDTDRAVKPGELLLVDSGAQYFDGTTDITRTIALSQEPTAAERHDFTLVMKGHIALASMVFPEGTTGHQLDAIARQYLWKEGLSYLHGTGHGVGHFLNVHEGPQSIRLNYVPAALTPGMITSNEPGLYRENVHGIRCENLVLTVEKMQTEFGRFYGFETLTLCPFDRALFDTSIMTNDEIQWLNNYHSKVAEALAPHLEGEYKAWLLENTKPLTK